MLMYKLQSTEDSVRDLYMYHRVKFHDNRLHRCRDIYPQTKKSTPN